MDLFTIADKARLRATFDKFDKDGSESIDLGELSDVMAHLGVKMSDAQLANLVAQANVNDKGELEFEAFAQLISIWREAAKMKIFDDFESSASEKIDAALQTTLLLTDSWGRCVFDAVVAFAAVLYFVIILIDDVAKFDVSAAVYSAEAVAGVVFAADVCVGLATFRGGDTLRGDAPKYLRSWFGPDLAALVPWGLILPGGLGTLLRHVRFVKLIKFVELWKSSGRMLMTPGYINFHYKILPITLLAVSFCLMVHGFTIGFIYVKQANGNDTLIDAQGSYPYVTAVYYVIYTLATVGYGNIDINTPNEKLYSCLVLCGAILSNGFIVGKLVAIMQRADVQQDKRGKLRQTLAVLEHFDLPHSLQDEVLQFQDHLLGHAIGSAYASTLAGMPPEMHSNINIVVKVRLLSCATFFEDLHAVVKVALAQRLTNAVLVPEQFVLGVAEEVKTICFIAYGFVDVVGQNGSRLRTLTSNQYFGGGMLIEDVCSTVAVKSLGYCDLWCLGRADLLALAKRFPPLQHVIDDAATRLVDFDCYLNTVKRRSNQAIPKRPVISVMEASMTSEILEDGELENAAGFNEIKTKAERMEAIWLRTNECHRRLRDLCETKQVQPPRVIDAARQTGP